MAILKYGTIYADQFNETVNNLNLWTGYGDDWIRYSGWEGMIDAGEGADTIIVENGSAAVFGGGGDDDDRAQRLRRL
ncbi:MAG: hypothetical protein HZY79_13725 [Rhodoblastus sp.]|nr:MAG: hypothetical protein HZY79_13725 [Rhodoblastus sp.]